MIVAATDKGVYGFDEGAPDRVPRELLSGVDVRAVDARHGAWWAITRDGALWRDGDLVARASGAVPTSLLVLDATVLVGARGPVVLRLTADDSELTLVDGFDAISTRDEWHAVGSPLHTRSLSGDANRVYAGIHVGGISVSTDAGRSWTATGFAVDDDVHEVHAGRGDVVFAAAGVGFGVSDDGAETWRWHDDGLHGTYTRAVATTARSLFVSASTGPFTNAAAVYRAPHDCSRAWEQCSEMFPDNIDTAHLVADRDGETVVFATDDGALHVSNDDGESWVRVETGGGSVSGLALLTP
jgi:hypothetical protein